MSAGDKYFQGNPIRLDVSRSKFPLNHNWRGSFNAGEWVPFFTQEVLAGDTFKVDANILLRSTTPSNPVMDDATISAEFFYVPFDLILSRSYMTPSTTDSLRSWRYFFGSQDSTLNMPTPANGVTLPTVNIYNNYNNSGDYLVGGLADCLGMPIPNGGGASYYKVNCLKALAYYAVYNEYLRDPNTMSPVTYSVNNSNGALLFSPNDDAGIPGGSDNSKFSKFPLVPACANHGFFGSALPWPQRNSVSVTLPLGSSAPVIDPDSNDGSVAKPYSMMFHSNGAVDDISGREIYFYRGSSSNYNGQAKIYPDTGEPSVVSHLSLILGSKNPNATSGGGLVADLSNATAASINTIRAAFATQRWYEQLSRSGNRYDEMIKGMFGVTPPVKGTKPEYLGGKDIPLNIQQVNGTGATNLGNAGATSNTFDAGHYFTKSFTEPGIIIGIMCVRTHDSFAQGIDSLDAKSERFDFYWPQFANLGEVGLKKKLLFVDANTSGQFTSDDESIFGYQEYAAEYRYHPDVVTGEFRPRSGVTGLPNWTYCNFFNSHPTLKEFLIGGSRFKNNVDRTLTVSATTAGYQFFGMVHMDVTAVRPMPLHSIPGLLDHH